MRSDIRLKRCVPEPTFMLPRKMMAGLAGKPPRRAIPARLIEMMAENATVNLSRYPAASSKR